MKTQNAKIKNPPRPLFSCGIFSYCTQTVLSPTNHQTPSLPVPLSDPQPPPPPPPPSLPPLRSQPPIRPQPDSSESSSSSTSQSFTQWRFPIPESPSLHHPQPEFNPPPQPESTSSTPPIPSMTLTELFHIAELQLSTESSYNSRLTTLHLLERSLVPNPPADRTENPTCPLPVMTGLISLLKDIAGAKTATKVLLALCLAETNRHVAVEAGAVNEVVEALAELEGAAAERALAALELLCTIPEGAEEIRVHALGVPMMVQMMGKMNGRGKECAISVLLVIFGRSGREGVEPVEEVARAVVLALQGDCSARGRRKGAQLLKCLQDGRLDLTEDDHVM